MVQVKMRYGIDLGTTNSAICKIENGEPADESTSRTTYGLSKEIT